MFKSVLQSVAANALALVATSYLLSGFRINNDIQTVLTAAVIIVLINFFVKPIVNLISFPINFVTLGFFSLIINAGLLYLATYLAGGIKIESGILTVNYFGLNMPTVDLPAWYLTLIVAATLISLISWLLRKILL